MLAHIPPNFPVAGLLRLMREYGHSKGFQFEANSDRGLLSCRFVQINDNGAERAAADNNASPGNAQPGI